MLRHLDEAHRVERLLPSQCGKTQIARIEADSTAIVAEFNSAGRVDIIIIMAGMVVFYVAGYLIEERRRWPVITASP